MYAVRPYEQHKREKRVRGGRKELTGTLANPCLGGFGLSQHIPLIVQLMEISAPQLCRLKSKTKGLACSGSGEGPVPGLQTVTFSLCPYLLDRREALVSPSF